MSTDKRLVDDLHRLLQTPRDRRLPETAARGPLAPSRGYAQGPEPEAPPSGGGGIASPLTEIEGSEDPPVQSREFFAGDGEDGEIVLISSDGLFTWVVEPLAVLRMTDAGDEEVEIRLRHPESGNLQT